MALRLALVEHLFGLRGGELRHLVPLLSALLLAALRHPLHHLAVHLVGPLLMLAVFHYFSYPACSRCETPCFRIFGQYSLMTCGSPAEITGVPTAPIITAAGATTFTPPPTDTGVGIDAVMVTGTTVTVTVVPPMLSMAPMSGAAPFILQVESSTLASLTPTISTPAFISWLPDLRL